MFLWINRFCDFIGLVIQRNKGENLIFIRGIIESFKVNFIVNQNKNKNKKIFEFKYV